MHPTCRKGFKLISGLGIQHQAIPLGILGYTEEACAPVLTSRGDMLQRLKPPSDSKVPEQADPLGRRGEDLDKRWHITEPAQNSAAYYSTRRSYDP